MTTTSSRRRRRSTGASAFLGLLLVGTATGPAHADTTRSEQWFLDTMHAESMWKTSTGVGITVAVIDTGVDPQNPDLKGRVLQGKDLAEGLSGDAHTDYDGHGTGMAGLIAGTGAYSGGQGAFGLAPGAKILPIRLPDGSKANNGAAADAQFLKATSTGIRYAADHGAKVINVSQGVEDDSEQLTEAVEYALNKGSLVFAAVGNTGDAGNDVQFPAGTPGVVGVGAVGKDLSKTTESQHGTQVDMSAPGDKMLHACGGGTGLCETHGSSDASALASASAALIWSKHPDWTNNQVLRVMLNTIGGPVDGAKRNDGIGYGIVRPRIALKTPGDPGPAGKYPLPDYPVVASKPPAAKPSKGAQAPDDTNSAAPAAASQGDDSNTPLWIGIGVGAATLVAAGIAIPVLRNRRRRSAPQPPAYPHAQAPGSGQPPYQAYSAPQNHAGSHDPNSLYGGPQGPGPSA
ncbi:type VII secretion-associated serine protease mycosin [Streptomyces sp. NBC_01003]|uniref:type VII secretion-associated serine protease mycosin n=1 Tax=Streptomyces sp. NBC_01003 TaxID=2903714 RepID=UPI003863CC6E|nr:type VII secretion-associated serine protease mycosin [Streptomyces sp. NBC_01003]